jgi:hypothetical protein
MWYGLGWCPSLDALVGRHHMQRFPLAGERHLVLEELLHRTYQRPASAIGAPHKFLAAQFREYSGECTESTHVLGASSHPTEIANLRSSC